MTGNEGMEHVFAQIYIGHEGVISCIKAKSIIHIKIKYQKIYVMSDDHVHVVQNDKGGFRNEIQCDLITDFC